MRQKLIEAGHGMRGDAGEHILEPCEGLYFDQLTGGHKAAQNSRRPAAAIAAKKGPVAAAHGPAA